MVFVLLIRRYEQTFARLVPCSHLCVSNYMREELIVAPWSLSNVRVLHDKPPREFRRLSTKEIHMVNIPLYLIFKFLSTQDYAKTESLAPLHTLLTQPPGIYKLNRPLLIVSSTSWTPDEDFSLLLRALDIYELHGSRDILLVITGRGALRAAFEATVAKRKYAKTNVYCVWLHIDDYPLLLGSADVGVCMHSSSSGVACSWGICLALGVLY
jgi:beta-1,4-mannosyltransferase